MLDIDDFKSYNNAHGHPVGDLALRELARVLTKTVRAVDVVTRYGGDEFAVVLPETEQSGALVVAEKIRDLVGTIRVPNGSMTVSLGIMCCPDPTKVTPESIILSADQALYRAKRAGGDRVSL